MLIILGSLLRLRVAGPVRGERVKAHQRQGDAGQSYKQAN